MFDSGIRVCPRSTTSLRLLVPGGAGDAEATALQGNNFSRLLPFSDGDLLRRQWRSRGDLCWSPRLAHRRLQVMMLLTCLIPRNMISGGNLSFARVTDVGFEGCVVGAGVGRCPWEAVYSAFAPSRKPSSAASTLWSLALASSDDWEAVCTVVTNRSLKSSRKMIKIFKLLCNFFYSKFLFVKEPVLC
ncbi:hypothetical protein HU200_046856 [Digitaria exilis]|uniref:Uncharacterized protein n=1 Tax=Digitaria exilis TaxID=1010633 RepID=A0A835AW09_9POAL|nr:hypothetical protein HU200_046856 [Digitaria exilis]